MQIRLLGEIGADGEHGALVLGHRCMRDQRIDHPFELRWRIRMIAVEDCGDVVVRCKHPTEGLAEAAAGAREETDAFTVHTR